MFFCPDLHVWRVCARVSAIASPGEETDGGDIRSRETRGGGAHCGMGCGSSSPLLGAELSRC